MPRRSQTSAAPLLPLYKSQPPSLYPSQGPRAPSRTRHWNGSIVIEGLPLRRRSTQAARTHGRARERAVSYTHLRAHETDSYL
eukprot:2038717-Pleurochrysis_carterae.AAC.1